MGGINLNLYVIFVSLVLVVAAAFVSILFLLKSRKVKISCSKVTGNDHILNYNDIYTPSGYNIVADESRRAKKWNSPFVKNTDTIETVKTGSYAVKNMQIKFEEDGEYSNELSN